MSSAKGKTWKITFKATDEQLVAMLRRVEEMGVEVEGLWRLSRVGWVPTKVAYAETNATCGAEMKQTEVAR
jgi:hypothetical protein